MSAPVNPYDTVPASQKPSGQPDLVSQIVPALAGGANSLLFGLPEAGIGALSKENRAAIDRYKAANPGYGVGETAGTIGSMFIPGGAIARTASGVAKGLGAIKVADTLGKVAKVASGPAGIKQGIATALEQAIPRAGAGALEGKDLGQNAMDVGTDAIAGGALGGALSGLGKVGKVVGSHFDIPNLGKELREGASESIVGNTLGLGRKQLMPLLAGLSPNSKLDKIDSIVDDLADILDSGPTKIRTVPKAEEVFGESGTIFKPFEKAYNAKPLGKMVDNIDAIVSHPDVAPVLKEFEGANAEGVLTDLIKSVDNVSAGKPNQWFAQRGILAKKIAEGMKADPQSPVAIQGELAKGLKQMIDDRAAQLVPPKEMAGALSSIIPKSSMDKIIASGYDPEVVLAVAKKTYPAILAAQSSLVMQKIKDLAPTSSAGSKTGFSTVMQAGDPVANLFNSMGGEALNKGASAINKGIGTETSSALRNFLTPDRVAQVNAIGEKVPGMVKKAVAPISPSVVAGVERSPVLSQIDSSPAQTVSPVLPLPDGYTGPVPPVSDASNRILQGIETAWNIEDPQGLIESQNPGAKQQFADQIKKNITNADGSINYFRASKILFPNQPDMASDFKKAYPVVSAIETQLDTAMNPLAKNNQLAKNHLQATLTDFLGQTGMDKKEAEPIIGKAVGDLGHILEMAATPEEKKAKIYTILKTVRPDLFGDNGIMKQVGVI